MQTIGWHRRERGAALMTALLITVLLGGLAAVITSITITETLIAGAHRAKPAALEALSRG